MESIAHLMERLTTEPEAITTLSHLMNIAHQQLSHIDKSSLSELDRRFSHGGGKIIADQILLRLNKQNTTKEEEKQ